jgi:hypothetical protein
LIEAGRAQEEEEDKRFVNRFMDIKRGRAPEESGVCSRLPWNMKTILV